MSSHPAAPLQTPPATHTAEDPSRKQILLVFAGLMVTMLLASLDQTIFSTALPTVVGELNGVNHMLWVTTAYILAATITLPIYGKLGDLIGRKGLFIGAISIFMLGSVIGGLAPDMSWLIVGRAVQGLGGGGLMLLSQAIIADVVPARERGKYMGIMGGVFALSSVAGPLLGGWFTEGIGWRWAFWMNLPLGALAIISAVIFLKLPQRPKRKVQLDTAGMALLAIASTCLVLTTTWGGTTYDWDSMPILTLMAGTVLAGVGFVFVERSAAEPIMPLHMFKERNFNLTLIAGLITGVAMFGALAYVPTYLQMVTGFSATEAGFLMIPMMAGMLLSSIGSGVLVTKTGRYKWMPLVGTFIVAGALVLLSTMTVATAVWVICAYLAIFGLGLGMGMQILILIVQNTFPNSEVGTATAANNYFRQIGASIGSAVVGSLFASRLTALLTERLPSSALESTGSINSFTPAIVRDLPDSVRNIIIGGYNEALTPVFLYLAPLVLIAVVLLAFIKEDPLATTIERDVVAETFPEDAASAQPESTMAAAQQVTHAAEADQVPDAE